MPRAAGPCARPSVLALLWRPLRERHRRIAHLRPLAIEREVDVLEPLLVVALGEVGAVLRSARLLALDRRDNRRLGAVDHEAELERAEDVLVEDRPAIVDPCL